MTGLVRTSSFAARLWLFLLMASGLPACAEEESRPEPGVLVVTEAEQTGAFVRNFNPLLEAGDVRWPARHSMYEPMLIYEPVRGDYVPWLATSCDFNETSTELACHLRPGVLFSDGTPLTSKDVAFTFELMKKFPAIDSRGTWQFLESIRTPSELETVFVFKRPYVPAFYYITHQPIVPEHIWKNVKDPVTFADPKPVGTGPFTEVLSFQSQAYRIGKNPHYWQPGKPKVKALHFQAFPGNDQVNLALLHDEVDWAGSFVPAIERIYVKTSPEHHKYWFPLIDGTVFLYPNCELKPLNDPRVRKALSMAIDRKAVVSVAMHGYTRPADATGLSDAWQRFRDPEAVKAGDWVKFDLVKAGKLLDEAGIRENENGRRELDGKPWAVSVSVPGGFSDWVRAGSLVVRNLKELHIDAKLDTLDFNAWFENLQKGDYQVSMGWSEVSPTPYFFYRGLMSMHTKQPIGELAAENWHRFALPESDVIFDQLEKITDKAEEARLYAQLQRQFVKYAPAIPLFPGASWGEFNTSRFTGFPDEKHPYAPLSPNMVPQSLLVLPELQSRAPTAAQSPASEVSPR
jgi:peptide/nickel transport system substrate-binding protein